MVFTFSGKVQFAGWTTSKDGPIAYTNGASYTMGKSDVTLFAVWSTNPSNVITFNANGGTGNMPPQMIISGSSAALTANTFTRPGSSFAGWATSKDGPIAYADGASYTMGTSDVMLFAVWSANPSYTITFDANGGTGTMQQQTIVSGLPDNLTANTFTRSGYSFIGWATSKDGPIAYADGASYTMGTSNVTLYAVWLVTSYMITFDANGGTGTMEPQSIESGSSAALTANTFTRSGYSFVGWATSADGQITYSDGVSYTMGTSKVTLYAVWLINSYTITFDANSGTGTMQPQSIKNGSSAALTTNTFTRINYSFVGWATSKDGPVAYANSASYTMSTSDVTLYAVWSTHPNYTITFDANGGTGTMLPLTIENGSSTVLTANEFTRVDYVFNGWSTNPTANVGDYMDETLYLMGTGNVTLYVIWEQGTPGLSYEIINGGTEYSVSKGTATTGALHIPAYYNTKRVTAISGNAFSNCTGFTGPLTIPESVTTIGEYAFSCCLNLTGNLIIPSSITSISNYAFNECRSLIGNLIIPDGVTAIGDGAFYNCFMLTGHLTIPESVTVIGYSAFCKCSGFDGNLTIPGNVKTIDKYAFYKCYGFDGSLTIQDGVTTINEGSFSDCINFTGNLTIPSSVTSIGDEAFRNCKKFDGHLTIPSSVTAIGEEAFRDCSSLTGDLTIPENVSIISEYAFHGCSGFNGRLTIPDSVKEIERYAFYGCSGLTGDLIIPSSVTIIDDYFAFSGCSGFNGSLTIQYGVTYIGDDAFSGCQGFTGTLTIPESVTTIGDRAFEDCRGFTGSLTIPSSVQTIYGSVFRGCSGFDGNLIIPEGVTTIGSRAFDGCSGFTGDLTIPSSVTSIEDWAFQGCLGFTGNLTIPSKVTEIENGTFDGCSGFTGTLTIPSSVTSIGLSSFYNCSGIKTVIVNASIPPTLYESSLDKTSFESIQVPSGSVGAYKEAPDWSDYVNRIVSQP